MKIIASPQFLKKVKKLSKQDHAEVERQIQKLLDNPNLGDVKKQDLAGVHVHKFKLNRKEILLSYRFTEESIILITTGVMRIITGTSRNTYSNSLAWDL